MQLLLGLGRRTVLTTRISEHGADRPGGNRWVRSVTYERRRKRTSNAIKDAGVPFGAGRGATEPNPRRATALMGTAIEGPQRALPVPVQKTGAKLDQRGRRQAATPTNGLIPSSRPHVGSTDLRPTGLVRSRSPVRRFNRGHSENFIRKTGWTDRGMPVPPPNRRRS